MPDQALSQHPFAIGLAEDDLLKLSACVVGRSEWDRGETVLQRGSQADACHLIVDGTIAIEIRAPGRTPSTLQTLHGGDLLGWSWLIEPHRWTFDARAVSVSSAITLDAELLRRTIENDSGFGLEIMQRVVRSMVSRLEATRLQVLDVYNR
jgi:CRP-like cAMP-binding protein